MIPKVGKAFCPRFIPFWGFSQGVTERLVPVNGKKERQSFIHTEIYVLIPLGFTFRPQYKLEYLGELQGLQWKYLLVTWDKLNDGKGWRWQRQVKQFGTRWSRFVEK